ncbi:MAG: hypothetical protein F4117_04775 [Acidimicrobiales bacterium]|nr:hypothetical protein [Acidimicrobiaceae bacterium]MXV87559.1 hypothetical protein [Acidimicrobiales bacterium]MCY3609519.1 hypothetical protein [Acidimicrobiaceae bacterium]MDE0678461.1 hypothetical protein [Acidimicrobiaceae bacterium]MXX43143.1 hypothetical protein [Acidimicrobiales bacterium]
MIDGGVTGTQIVVEAWTVLVAAAALIAGMIGTGLGITFHLSGRIDHQSDRIDHQSDRIDRIAEEVALVRERVARLEGNSGTPDPGPLQLA